uniref:Polyhomeotic-like protein 2 n=1 Tax=Gasterosteus aculeatus aculeatus TaxID=481459 RepID=A0AAQ4QLR0_GASAC
MECIERLSTVSGSSVPRLNIEFVCHAPLGGINSGDTRTPIHQGLLGVPSAPCFLPSWCNSLSCYNELCSSVQVERPSFSIDILRRPTADSKMEGLPAKEPKAQKEPMLTCELCGKVDFAYVFKRSKRFCSTVCAKRYNVGCTKRMGLFPNRQSTLESVKKHRAPSGHLRNGCLEPKKKKPAAAPPPGHSAYPAQGESSQCSDLSGYGRPPSPPSASQPRGFLPGDPGQWNIQDVYGFISALPGCLEIAEEFRCQEIDGQALLLLNEDHLMGAMNIKLGPALKIFAQISTLKDS